ncbi:uncharacterized protein EV420DRAFT_1545643, partial [Desarmillaria tabescens]
MDVLGFVILAFLVCAMINKFGPVSGAEIMILILAVFCAVFFIGAEFADSWPLLWSGLESITGLVGGSIRFIIHTFFLIARVLYMIGNLAPAEERGVPIFNFFLSPLLFLGWVL